MSYKKGDWVLIQNGRAGYMLAQVAYQDGDGYQIMHGYYTTYWAAKSCHKPPKSILAELTKGRQDR